MAIRHSHDLTDANSAVVVVDAQVRRSCPDVVVPERDSGARCPSNYATRVVLDVAVWAAGVATRD